MKSAKAEAKHCRFLESVIFPGFWGIYVTFVLLSFDICILWVHVAFVFLSFDVFICVGCVWLLFIRGIVSGDCEPCIVLLPPLTRVATTFRFCNCVCVCFCICYNIALCVSSSSMQCSLYLTPSASFGFTFYLNSSCIVLPLLLVHIWRLQSCTGTTL